MLVYGHVNKVIFDEKKKKKKFFVVVYYRYGNDAGNLTENALYATGGIAMTAYNASNIGVKAMAKRAAKDTGRAVVEDYNKKAKSHSHSDSGSNSPEGPDDMPPPPKT